MSQKHPRQTFSCVQLPTAFSRFSKNQYFSTSEPRSRGKVYAEEAMRLLHRQLIKPTVTTVQSCILIAHYLGGEGDVKSKHIYIGIARLHSQAIHLWETLEDSDIITREIRRRTWLSVVIAEKWSAADMSIQSVIYEDHGSIFPSLDEIEFLAIQPGTSSKSTNPQASKHSMWAQMAATINVFRNIHDIILSLSLNLRSIQSYQHEISRLEHQLDQWVESLPEELTYTMHNLAYFANAGLGRTFLSMHIGHHHFRQLLYYPFLDPRQYQQPHDQLHQVHFSGRYAKLCQEHAMAVSDIAKVSFRTSGCDLVYYLSGHILVVSSSIHLHTLLFSEEQTKANMARERLISNFEMLMNLKIHWPVIDLSVRDKPISLSIYARLFASTYAFVLDDRRLGRAKLSARLQ
jgi:hypothetical protein